MNKIKLIDELKMSLNLSSQDAAQIVKIFFDTISTTLEKGDRVEIRGLCSFFVKKYKGYVGRNPKTGETIKVKRKKLPTFRCGKNLKQRVDY